MKTAMLHCYMKENAWIAKKAARKLKASRMALVIHRTIYLHGITATDFLKNKAWVRHEVCHVKQYKRFTTGIFLVVYLWYSLRHGYYNNPLEIEARAAESNPAMMDDTILIPPQ